VSMHRGGVREMASANGVLLNDARTIGLCRCMAAAGEARLALQKGVDQVDQLALGIGLAHQRRVETAV